MDALFVNHVKNALNNLYNLKQLGGNPLCSLLGLTSSFEAPAQLQRILKDAIADLKPKYGEPRSSNKWQVYELLSLRYVQQFSQKEVAGQLGISISKLNRVQQTAIDMLAVFLMEKFSLSDAGLSLSKPSLNQPDPAQQQADETAAPRETAGETTYAWAAEPSLEKTTSLPATLNEVIRLIHPLTSRYPIRIEQHLEPTLPETLVHPLAMQQILINILTTAIQYLQGGTIHLSATHLGSSIRLYLEGRHAITGEKDSAGQQGLGRDMKINLDAAIDLASISGGDLVAAPAGDSITITVTLPVISRIPVLVVDDNEDSIHLLAHYVENTPFQLYSELNPWQAIERAQVVGARVVIVDVMMPRLDGWNLVQYLRNAPALTGVAVVVSSILRQEELALSLGADAFLPKPVNQKDFLALLSRLASPRVEKPD